MGWCQGHFGGDTKDHLALWDQYDYYPNDVNLQNVTENAHKVHFSIIGHGKEHEECTQS